MAYASLASVADYITTVPAKNIIGLDRGYASYSCPFGNSSCFSFQGCNWDNDSWICLSSFVNVPCIFQWSVNWPSSADKNPATFTLSAVITSTSSITSSSSAITNFISSPSISFTSLPTNDNNPYLAEKIAIPLGTTMGVGSGSGLAYYLWRRKKRKTLIEKQGEFQIVTTGNNCFLQVESVNKFSDKLIDIEFTKNNLENSQLLEELLIKNKKLTKILSSPYLW